MNDSEARIFGNELNEHRHLNVQPTVELQLQSTDVYAAGTHQVTRSYVL